jgi:UV excision repair protein RAD23
MNLILGGDPNAGLSSMGGAGAGHAGHGHGGANPPGTIRVSQEEMDAINRLTSLGFPKHKAAEAYFACDKNEELAANFLFETGGQDEDEMLQA